MHLTLLLTLATTILALPLLRVVLRLTERAGTTADVASVDASKCGFSTHGSPSSSVRPLTALALLLVFETEVVLVISVVTSPGIPTLTLTLLGVIAVIELIVSVA